MIWSNEIQWWAYDVDIPINTISADVVFTANPKPPSEGSN